MNKKEFTKAIVDKLHDNGERKPVRTPGHVFHITDNYGNKKDFVAKTEQHTEVYTEADVKKVIDAGVEIIKEALAHGQTVVIPGFGSFGLKWRKARSTKDIKTGEPIVIQPRYVPRFFFGRDLRICGKLYELSLGDLSLRGDTSTDCENEEEDGDV